MKAIFFSLLAFAACAPTEGDPSTDQEDFAVNIAQPVHIENNYTGKCFDIANGVLNVQGQPLDQYQCHSDYPDQTFDVVPAAAYGGGTIPGMYNIKVHNTNMCVTPLTPVNGGIGKLGIVTCSVYNPDAWVLSTTNAAPGTYYLQNQYYSGSCVDVPGGWTSDSLQLQIYPCHQLTQVNNQQWIIYN
jgi:hypothetical protein